MNATAVIQPGRGHAAPSRHKVGILPLCFGILGAPTAWFAACMIGYLIASHVCTSSPQAAAVLTRATSPGFVLMTLLALLIALGSCRVAFDNWRRTRDEQPGSGHHLLDRGEGRTRFLAMCGMLASVGFSIAFAFTISSMVTAPLCSC